MKKIFSAILMLILCNLSAASDQQNITEAQAIEIAKQEGFKQGYEEEWFGGPIFVLNLGPLTGHRWEIQVHPKTFVQGGLFTGCFIVRVSEDGLRTKFKECEPPQ